MNSIDGDVAVELSIALAAADLLEKAIEKAIAAKIKLNLD